MSNPTDLRFIRDHQDSFYEMLCDTDIEEFAQALKQGNASLGRLFSGMYYEWRDELEEELKV